MSNTTKSDRPVIATGGTSGGVNRATPHKRYDPRLKRGRERWEGRPTISSTSTVAVQGAAAKLIVRADLGVCNENMRSFVVDSTRKIDQRNTHSERVRSQPSAASCSKISRSSLARSASRILMSVSDS